MKNLCLLLVFLFLLVGHVFSQDFLHVYDVNNKEWHCEKGKKYLIILKNNKSCLQCYKDLYTYIRQVDSLKDWVICCVSHVDSSAFARKSEQKEIQNLMPGITNVFYDYRTDAEDIGYSSNMSKNSVFYQFKVDICPSVLLISGDSDKYRSYENIFAGVSIRPEFLK